MFTSSNLRLNEQRNKRIEIQLQSQITLLFLYIIIYIESNIIKFRPNN